ncbi:MAG: ABC transporter permease [Mycobacteriales bacterium]
MVAFVIRRLLYSAVMLAIISFLTFAIVASAPGNPLELEAQRLRTVGDTVSQAQLVALHHQYGLDSPWLEQYWIWLKNIVHGDFGPSILASSQISTVLAARLGLSLLFSVGALVIAWAIAVPVSIHSATHRGSVIDRSVRVFQFAGIALPQMILALEAMFLFSNYLDVDIGSLYSNAYQHAPWSWGKLADLFKHLWIPLLVISVGSTAVITQLLRANLLGVLNAPYIAVARAKGLSGRRIVWRHAMRSRR